MKTIQISSLPLRDVISDIADGFGTSFEKKCGIFTVSVPDNLGSGIISGIDFDGGLGLIRYECDFHTDLTFEYSLDRVHPVKFLFCLEGEMSHNFTNETEWHTISQHKNAVVASSSNHGHRVRFQAGNRTIYSSLELERKSFQGKLNCAPKISRSWLDMLNDVNAKKKFYHDGFYSLRISEILQEWDSVEDTDFLKSLLLESLAYKILVLQITQFQDDLKSEGKKTLLRKSELNRMLKAMDVIEKNLTDLPTIQEIASEIGLSPTKLQQGFKELYGKTVNKFILGKRMEVAKTLLLNTDDSISSISHAVGINSVSYFSKIFNKAYGMVPSEFHRQRERPKIDMEALVKEKS